MATPNPALTTVIADLITALNDLGDDLTRFTSKVGSIAKASSALTPTPTLSPTPTAAPAGLPSPSKNPFSWMTGNVKDIKAPKEGESGKDDGGMFGALGSLKTGTLAAVGAMVAIPAAVTKFVSAFNPGAIELFNMAMENINATIGHAFEPLIQIATDVARQVNDLIAPAFDALRPIIEKVARQFGERLPAVVKLFSEVFKSLMPIIDVVIDVFRPFMEIIPAIVEGIRAWQAVIRGIVSIFGVELGDFAEEVKKISDQFVEGIKGATRAVIIFAARMAKLFGLDSVIKSLQKTFGPKDPNAPKGKVAAPKDFGITDASSILRESTLAAAQASAGGNVKPVEDWLGDISKQLEDVLKAQGDWKKQVTDAIIAVLGEFGIKAAKEDIEKIRSVVEAFQKTGDKLAPNTVGGQTVRSFFAIIPILEAIARKLK